MQLQRADAAGGIEPGLALHRERLQRHRVVRAADQSIGADPAGEDQAPGADRRAGFQRVIDAMVDVPGVLRTSTVIATSAIKSNMAHGSSPCSRN